MNLANFRIRQVTFEIRYEDAFILWDVAGAISTELAAVWPGLKFEDAKPNQQILAARGVRIQTGLRLSHVTIHSPKTLLQHVEQIGKTHNIWTEMLGLKKLNRVGTRTIYARDFDTEEEAGRASVNLGLVRIPEPPIFNHREKPWNTAARFFWRDAATTTFLSVSSERQVLEIEAAPDFAEQSRSSSKNLLLVDIDRATREPLELSRFNLRQWFEGVQHVQARDLPKILGG